MTLEPGPEERALLKEAAAKVVARIEALGIEAIVGGSYAKDTWVSGSREVDVFARFPAANEEELEAQVPALFAAFPEAEHVHGSRTYLRADIGGVTVEIIPIRPLTDDANTMDHSPDHITYVQKHLTSPNDVRRLKSLLRENRIYGAESHVRGFSGYVCELLIIAYSTLEKLAQEAASWEEGTRVRFHDEGYAFEAVLIVEDPTDPRRNAAAAVDERAFRTFTKLMDHIRSGRDERSIIAPIEPPYVRVVMHGSHEKQDISFAQLRTIHDRLERELEPFGVRDAQWHTNGSWESRFSLERTELEPVQVRIGPPISIPDAVSAFTEHHPDAYEEDGRIIAQVERTETHWKQIVDRVCAHPSVASYTAEEVR